jgi:uncharacterized membrane protein
LNARITGFFVKRLLAVAGIMGVVIGFMCFRKQDNTLFEDDSENPMISRNSNAPQLYPMYDDICRILPRLQACYLLQIFFFFVVGLIIFTLVGIGFKAGWTKYQQHKAQRMHSR